LAPAVSLPPPLTRANTIGFRLTGPKEEEEEEDEVEEEELVQEAYRVAHQLEGDSSLVGSRQLIGDKKPPDGWRRRWRQAKTSASRVVARGSAGCGRSVGRGRSTGAQSGALVGALPPGRPPPKTICSQGPTVPMKALNKAATVQHAPLRQGKAKSLHLSTSSLKVSSTNGRLHENHKLIDFKSNNNIKNNNNNNVNNTNSNSNTTNEQLSFHSTTTGVVHVNSNTNTTITNSQMQYQPNQLSTSTIATQASATYEPQRRHIHAQALPQTNTKALVTTLLILGTYFISYVPAIIYQVLTCIDYCPYPLYDISFSRRVLFGAMTTLLLIAKSIVDPLIYSYRMNEIQQAINRYLSKRRSRSSNQQQGASLRTSLRHTSTYPLPAPAPPPQQAAINQPNYGDQQNFADNDDNLASKAEKLLY